MFRRFGTIFPIRKKMTILVSSQATAIAICSAVVLDAAQSAERDTPEYLEVDHRAMKGRFVRTPKLSDVPYPVAMEPNLVVEFYSR